MSEPTIPAGARRAGGATIVLMVLAVLLTHVSGSAAAAPPKAPPPNVLFIAVDDLNHWVRHLGRNKQSITPNIDRLAAQGVTFTRAYCASPSCNPSRAALMSGLRPATTGVYENDTDWRPHVPVALTLPTHFRNHGYFVAGAGKIYHGGYDRRDEWDDYMFRPGGDPRPTIGPRGVGGIQFAPLDANDEDMADYRIASWTIDQLGRKHDRPFFLACGLHKPHMPWNVPRKYYDMHPLEKIQLPPTRPEDLTDVPPAGVRMATASGDHARMLESGRWAEAVQAYLAAITFSDAQIGRVLDALERSPYRKNTIVVLWGDHGWHLGEKEHWRKFALWEEATRSPLVWRVPGVTKPRGVCNRTVDLMSLYPTLSDLCGLPVPSHVEGVSIRSLLKNPSAKWNTSALTTYGFQNHAIRTEQWRYIRYAGGGEELYDERKDPYEWTNRAAEPKNAAVKAELARRLPQVNTPDAGGRRGRRAAPNDGE
ncbi:MAG: arylsulfatase family protein [Armatimonadetes bacterium]|jgi:arylsulfatase A-like enzyme|nr:arylsulfatase family protein [Armatimonadota bacterium]